MNKENGDLHIHYTTPVLRVQAIRREFAEFRGKSANRRDREALKALPR